MSDAITKTQALELIEIVIRNRGNSQSTFMNTSESERIKSMLTVYYSPLNGEEETVQHASWRMASQLLGDVIDLWAKSRMNMKWFDFSEIVRRTHTLEKTQARFANASVDPVSIFYKFHEHFDTFEILMKKMDPKARGIDDKPQAKWWQFWK